MKRLIVFIAFLIFIPFFIVIIYNKNYKEIKLKYNNNIHLFYTIGKIYFPIV